MSLPSQSLRNPYLILSLVLAVVAMGLIGFFRNPVDLFPETTPPQVVVVTVEPGATAKDVSDRITEVLEKEINTLSGLKRITAISRDEVSSLNAEFFYSKPIGEAVTDVQNAISRIRAQLPKDILEPRIYRITDATRALLTLAMSPKEGGGKDLAQVRLLADNQIRDALLRLPGIADVDVFGGFRPAVRIFVDRDKLQAYGLTIDDVIARVTERNVTIPSGYIYSRGRELLLKGEAEFKSADEIGRVVLKQTRDGYIELRHVARVVQGYEDPRSLYHGNGRRAIALNVLRPDHGDTVAAIRTFKKYLPKLKAQYPDVRFEITDDQEPIIDINVQGMRKSVIQAIILTVAVIFLFLADVRAAAIVSVSIPLAFLGTMVMLWFSPYTLNMVTLSGVIIAIGMVVDASVVVLENIYRHHREEPDKPPEQVALEGTDEVGLAITAGMFTTVIVLIPVMFTGEYTQRVLRPLTLTISTTLVGSLLAAMTVVPLIASRLLRQGEARRSWFERLVGNIDKLVSLLATFYVGACRLALKAKLPVVIAAFALFVFTVKTVPPIIGGELMTPMDTGIAIVNFETPADYDIHRVEDVLSRVEAMIKEQPGVLTISSVVGSEPGEISFGGGGRTLQGAKIVVRLVDRMHRKQTIWEIEDKWRATLAKMSGVRAFTVTEYGATPLSTTKAPLDIILSGPDSRVLDKLADETLAALKGVHGLVDARRSWYFDKPEYAVKVDPHLARLYGTSEARVAQQVKLQAKGATQTLMRLEDYLDIPVRIEYDERFLDDPSAVGNGYIATAKGRVPLRTLATIAPRFEQSYISREDLHNTIDITGVNRIYTIAQTAKQAAMRVKKKIHLPAGYQARVAGTIADMKESKKRMMKALRVGVLLLFFLLLAMFKSFSHPITIMVAIPLAFIGAFWGLLAFGKPMCKPATMGMILLGGTIVNNSILLLDFILAARRRGVPRDEAIAQAVRLRIRPILMTTASTVVGLTPLILELAIGLERMSPLGIVAASGLIVGTFFTMVVVPAFYALLDDLTNWLRPASSSSE